MDLHALRFYIIERILKDEPKNGFTHEQLHNEMETIFDEVSDKSVRTILNGLEESGILRTHKEGKVKHYFLDRSSMMSIDPEHACEIYNNEYIVIASVFSAMLNELYATDLNHAANAFQKQLGYVINIPDARIKIDSISQNIMFDVLGLRKLTRGHTSALVQLLQKTGHKTEIELSDGSTRSFVPYVLVLRNTVPVLCGYDAESHTYSELFPDEIVRVKKIGRLYEATLPDASERARLDIAHLAVGRPSASQTEDIVLELDDEAIARLQAKPMTIDFELVPKENKLFICHAITTDLADWIIGLGSGVKVIEPFEMRERVKQRLLELLTAYESSDIQVAS
ncbi:hypothetical protein CYPRO_0861 [Cyclonatronum proteinivorum]|uniref:WCX domain-containing protein n=1 Tax=Cyclonatronum proteinivorum TaxID=1457365 RepID=A0A345UI36_9BACT|nr:WYL domain-containing protein [Cyclonatronum proteinivorum]AXJ00138.1 hypothetical protein CYPRO_0861 [Cyclonatronum proteinivorum]